MILWYIQCICVRLWHVCIPILAQCDEDKSPFQHFLRYLVEMHNLLGLANLKAVSAQAKASNFSTLHLNQGKLKQLNHVTEQPQDHIGKAQKVSIPQVHSHGHGHFSPLFLDRFGTVGLFGILQILRKTQMLIQQKSNFGNFQGDLLLEPSRSIKLPQKNWGHVGFLQKGHIAMEVVPPAGLCASVHPGSLLQKGPPRDLTAWKSLKAVSLVGCIVGVAFCLSSRDI